MLTIIWSRLGFLVPIITVLSGIILAQFYDDQRIGNFELTGFICLASAVLTLIIGLIVPKKNEHSFFFIPMWIWGFVFGGLSFFFLYKSKQPIETSNIRFVHLYNSSEDSLRFSYVLNSNDPKNVVIPPQKMKKVSLYTGQKGLIKMTTYSINGDTIADFPNKEIANDTSKYELITNKKGIHGYFRKVAGGTTVPYSHDYAFLSVDKTKDLLEIAISDLFIEGKREIKPDSNYIKKHIVARHKAGDLITPSTYAQTKSNVYYEFDERKIPSYYKSGSQSYYFVLVDTNKELDYKDLVERLLNKFD